ncbi:hypothetical protein BGC31_01145 [Komagataeibacter xylinus]|nr:hypothetical protein BGC31_01145 [Komagataeibacter xylinus]
MAITTVVTIMVRRRLLNPRMRHLPHRPRSNNRAVLTGIPVMSVRIANKKSPVSDRAFFMFWPRRVEQAHPENAGWVMWTFQMKLSRKA